MRAARSTPFQAFKSRALGAGATKALVQAGSPPGVNNLTICALTPVYCALPSPIRPIVAVADHTHHPCLSHAPKEGEEFVCLPLPANAGTLFNFLPRSQQLSSLNCVCAHCFLSFRAGAGAMAAACRRQADAKVSRKALDQTAVSRLA